MSVEKDQDKLEELKLEAEELGISFAPNIGEDTLQSKIDAKKKEIADKQAEKKAQKEAKKSVKKVKVIIEPRDSDLKQQDQFFGFNSENILVQFGEEVEISESMYKFIEGLYGKTKVFTMGKDEEGNPKKIWKDKKESRFFVKKVD